MVGVVAEVGVTTVVVEEALAFVGVVDTPVAGLLFVGEVTAGAPVGFEG